MATQVIPGVGPVHTDLGPLAPAFRAKRVENDGKGVPTGASIIGRGTQVVLDRRMHVGAPENVEAVPDPVYLEAPKTIEGRQDVVFADRPTPADTDGITADYEQERPIAKVKKAEAVAEKTLASDRVQTKIGAVGKPTVYAQSIPEEEKPQAVTPKQPDMPPLSPRNTVQQPVAQAVIKKKIKLSSSQIGTMRLKVADVVVSETLVVLAYGLDDDNIVEPPPHGADSPLLVEVDGKVYPCLAGNLTAEMQGQLLVVLVRVPADT